MRKDLALVLGITRLMGNPAMLAYYFQIQERELKAKAVPDPRAAVATDVP